MAATPPPRLASKKNHILSPLRKTQTYSAEVERLLKEHEAVNKRHQSMLQSSPAQQRRGKATDRIMQDPRLKQALDEVLDMSHITGNNAVSPSQQQGSGQPAQEQQQQQQKSLGPSSSLIATDKQLRDYYGGTTPEGAVENDQDIVSSVALVSSSTSTLPPRLRLPRHLMTHRDGVFLLEASLEQRLKSIAKEAKEEELGQHEVVVRSQKVFNDIVQELTRQISTECQERGRLLAKLWIRYSDLVNVIAELFETERSRHEESEAQMRSQLQKVRLDYVTLIEHTEKSLEAQEESYAQLHEEKVKREEELTEQLAKAHDDLRQAEAIARRAVRHQQLLSTGLDPDDPTSMTEVPRDVLYSGKPAATSSPTKAESSTTSPQRGASPEQPASSPAPLQAKDLTMAQVVKRLRDTQATCERLKRKVKEQEILLLDASQEVNRWQEQFRMQAQNLVARQSAGGERNSCSTPANNSSAQQPTGYVLPPVTVERGVLTDDLMEKWTLVAEELQQDEEGEEEDDDDDEEEEDVHHEAAAATATEGNKKSASQGKASTVSEEASNEDAALKRPRKSSAGASSNTQQLRATQQQQHEESGTLHLVIGDGEEESFRGGGGGGGGSCASSPKLSPVHNRQRDDTQ